MNVPEQDILLLTNFLMWQCLLFQHHYHYYCVVGLKIFSLPTFALKALIEFSYGTCVNDQKPALIPHKNSLLNHYFLP